MIHRLEVREGVDLGIVLRLRREDHGNLAHNDWKIPDIRYKGNVTLKLRPSSRGEAELGLEKQGVVRRPDDEVWNVEGAVSGLEGRVVPEAEARAFRLGEDVLPDEPLIPQPLPRGRALGLWHRRQIGPERCRSPD